MTPTTRELWNHVLTLGKDSTFTGPQFRQKFCPKVDYKVVYNRLSYLHKIGVISKTNTWDGENQIIYKVADTNRVPRTIDLSAMKVTAKRGYIPTGKGLYKGVSSRAAPKVVVTNVVQGASLIADEIIALKSMVKDTTDKIADQMVNLLEAAKDHPQASVNNFTTAELFTELERRTRGPST